MTEREMVEALLSNDDAWTQIVQAIGEKAVKVYIQERKREETYDRALVKSRKIPAAQEPKELPTEKTWHEIGQDLKPEILGWRWAGNGQ